MKRKTKQNKFYYFVEYCLSFEVQVKQEEGAPSFLHKGKEGHFLLFFE